MSRLRLACGICHWLAVNHDVTFLSGCSACACCLSSGDAQARTALPHHLPPASCPGWHAPAASQLSQHTGPQHTHHMQSCQASLSSGVAVSQLAPAPTLLHWTTLRSMPLPMIGPQSPWPARHARTAMGLRWLQSYALAIVCSDRTITCTLSTKEKASMSAS